MNYKIIFLIVLFLCLAQAAGAEEFNLKNGDKITGIIVEETEDFIVINTAAMGPVKLNKGFIKKQEEEKKTAALDEEAPEIEWDRKVSLGYNRSSGNTNSSELNSSFLLNKKRPDVDEVTLEGDIYYSSSDKKMDAQKWKGSGRYASSFGIQKKWYNFYKMAVDHDRFSNIDYRLLPSAGAGHWFYDTDPLKLLAETALGYEYTDYRDATDESKEIVLIPRLFFEKIIFGDSKIMEDLIFYPKVDDLSDYRLHSKTILKNPLRDNLSLDLSFIEDYDSKPTEDTKKNDFRIITSLTYSF